MINVTFEIKGEKPDLTNILESVYTKFFSYEEDDYNVGTLNIVLISLDSLKKLKRNLNPKRNGKTKVRIIRLKKLKEEFRIKNGR